MKRQIAIAPTSLLRTTIAFAGTLMFALAAWSPVSMAYPAPEVADAARSVLHSASAVSYQIGSPVLTDIWVDPAKGNDRHTGSSRKRALRTLAAAWDRIPMGKTLRGTGYRVLLAPGTYAKTVTYWESRHGTQKYPIIIQAADGPGTAHLEDMNVFDCHYLYLIGLDLSGSSGDVLHLAKSDYVLLRQARLTGIGHGPDEVLKANESKHIFVEDSELSGTHRTVLDYVAVQYGHIVRSRFHDSTDWCVYLKGGSANFWIEGNEIYDCGSVGFSAGQGTGFEFMVPPWLNYEAYEIKFVNNLVHDTQKSGAMVYGGFDILIAHNTLYRVGLRSHLLQVGHGGRECDHSEHVPVCLDYLKAGGWGRLDAEAYRDWIPSRNVYIYNNIFFNPEGRSRNEALVVQGPVIPPPGSNAPSPSCADTNLQIRGNIIWNGPSQKLELGDEPGCSSANPTCNEKQLRSENAINTLMPQLADPAHGNFAPLPGGNVFHARTYDIPEFPLAADGMLAKVPRDNLANRVANDRSGKLRVLHLPGADGSP